MNKLFKAVFICALISAFALIGSAAVLPHTHGGNAPHHACWISHAKHVVLSPAEGLAAVGPPTGTVLIALQEAQSLLQPVEFSLHESRAPPVSPVLSL